MIGRMADTNVPLARVVTTTTPNNSVSGVFPVQVCNSTLDTQIWSRRQDWERQHQQIILAGKP
jgi:hypothetical protein